MARPVGVRAGSPAGARFGSRAFSIARHDISLRYICQAYAGGADLPPLSLPGVLEQLTQQRLVDDLQVNAHRGQPLAPMNFGADFRMGLHRGEDPRLV